MSDEQKEQAEALYEVADLASYYRVGIEKSVAAIPAGNDFEIAKDIRVIVVEKEMTSLRFGSTRKLQLQV